jgi:hypothetical protein
MHTERQRLEVAESVSQKQPRDQGLLAKYLEKTKPGPPDFWDDYPNGSLFLVIMVLGLLIQFVRRLL